MKIDPNKTPGKSLLIFFIINFVVFYIVNKLFHYYGFLEEKQTFLAEILYSLWMATFMTILLNWNIVKSFFSKKKNNEGTKV